jgi:hypothetical protein
VWNFSAVASGFGMGDVLGCFQIVNQPGKPVFSLVGKVCDSPQAENLRYRVVFLSMFCLLFRFSSDIR